MTTFTTYSYYNLYEVIRYNIHLCFILKYLANPKLTFIISNKL